MGTRVTYTGGEHARFSAAYLRNGTIIHNPRRSDDGTITIRFDDTPERPLAPWLLNGLVCLPEHLVHEFTPDRPTSP